MTEVKQISGLTPLRGIAALLVMLMHYQLFIAPLLPLGTTHLFDKLYLMVDLFFVLSGFIMYHVYGNLFKTGVDKTSFMSFFRARFARIYPLHIVTLGYLVALAFSSNQAGFTIDGFAGFMFNYEAIPYQLLMLQGVGPYHEALWNSPSWSISTEWWAYMIFPISMLFLCKLGAWFRGALLLSIVGIYLWIMFDLQPSFWAIRWEAMGIPESVPYPVGTIDVITGSALLRCFCGFVLGLITYELYLGQFLKSILRAGWVFCTCWVFLLLGWHFDMIYDPIAVGIFAIMILSISFNNGRLESLLNARFLRFLGDISYSLYLVHMPIILTYIVYRKAMYYPDAQESMAGVGYNFTLSHSWIGLVLFLIVTIPIASLSYRFVEKPARKMLK